MEKKGNEKAAGREKVKVIDTERRNTLVLIIKEIGKTQCGLEPRKG
jgi:hypothetical protein